MQYQKQMTIPYHPAESGALQSVNGPEDIQKEGHLSNYSKDTILFQAMIRKFEVGPENTHIAVTQFSDRSVVKFDFDDLEQDALRVGKIRATIWNTWNIGVSQLLVSDTSF